MTNYFQEVTKSLTLNDMNVLAVLYDSEANASYKAMKNVELLEKTRLSEANYRKIIYRLAANKFVEIVNHQKFKTIYITTFGIEAIHTVLKGVGA